MFQVTEQTTERRDSGIFAVGVRDYASDDECELVAGVVANDPRAWREFQRRYDRLVLRCITKVTKGFSSVSIDDVREIYGQLYLSFCSNGRAKLAAFDPARGCSLSSYVGMLATHCAYDWLRVVRREPQREALAVAEELSADCPNPYEAAEQNERAKLAAQVLEGFSERDRVFASLYFGEGMDPDEIARSMNISVKTVYSKKHKIQSKLESLVANMKGTDIAA